jgi:hypothetical protein
MLAAMIAIDDARSVRTSSDNVAAIIGPLLAPFMLVAIFAWTLIAGMYLAVSWAARRSRLLTAGAADPPTPAASAIRR